MKIDWNNGRSKLNVILLVLDIALMCLFGSQGAWFASMVMLLFALHQFERLYWRDRLPQEVLDEHKKITEKWEET